MFVSWLLFFFFNHRFRFFMLAFLPLLVTAASQPIGAHAPTIRKISFLHLSKTSSPLTKLTGLSHHRKIISSITPSTHPSPQHHSPQNDTRRHSSVTNTINSSVIARFLTFIHTFRNLKIKIPPTGVLVMTLRVASLFTFLTLTVVGAGAGAIAGVQLVTGLLVFGASCRSRWNHSRGGRQGSEGGPVYGGHPRSQGLWAFQGTPALLLLSLSSSSPGDSPSPEGGIHKLQHNVVRLVVVALLAWLIVRFQTVWNHILKRNRQDHQDNTDHNHKNHQQATWSNIPIVENVMIFVPVIYFSAVFLGTLFYHYVENFTWAMAIYFSVQALMGNMYGEPEMETPLGQGVTSVLFVVGVTILATAIGSFASASVDRASRLISSKAMRDPDILDDDQNGIVTLKERILYVYDQTKKRLRWHEDAPQHILNLLTLGWFLLGVAWGRVYETYDWWNALYFAFGAIISSGWPCPPCQSNPADGNPSCSLGTPRALFVALYITVGVTLFYRVMSRWADLVIRRATQREEIRKLAKPINKQEFMVASTFIQGNARPNPDQIDFPQFIVLAMFRLERLTQQDLIRYRALFEKLDRDHSGYISLDEVNQAQQEILNNLKLFQDKN